MIEKSYPTNHPPEDILDYLFDPDFYFAVTGTLEEGPMNIEKFSYVKEKIILEDASSGCKEEEQ